MLERSLLKAILSVCPSVRPSVWAAHWWSTPKRLNILKYISIVRYSDVSVSCYQISSSDRTQPNRIQLCFIKYLYLWCESSSCHRPHLHPQSHHPFSSVCCSGVVQGATEVWRMVQQQGQSVLGIVRLEHTTAVSCFWLCMENHLLQLTTRSFAANQTKLKCLRHLEIDQTSLFHTAYQQQRD